MQFLTSDLEKDSMEYNVAIVLAGGRGSRMNSDIPKQYMPVCDRPVLFYSLKVFEEHEKIQEVILVAPENDKDYCKKEIIDKYEFKKVKRIVAGGSERFNSVYNALKNIRGGGYVFIHDAARPCITKKIIDRLYEAVKIHNAVVAAVKSKDTVKISEDGFVSSTPDRNNVWIVQTPQVFKTENIKKAYDVMMAAQNVSVTDDAMVMEHYGEDKIYLCEASYSNIKITTGEDIFTVENFFKKSVDFLE